MKTRIATVTPLQVGATFVGATMGAGFATGQEILQFFGYFGAAGLWGVMLAASLLGVFAYAILDIAHRLGAASHREVIRHIAGSELGTGADYLVTFFLFGGMVSMVAGSGALMSEQFNWSPFTGAVVMAVISAVTVLLGLQGIVDSMTFLAPLMVVGIVALGLWSALATGYFFRPLLWRSPASAPVPFWPLSAVVYASYNLILVISVLAPLGATLPSRDDAARSATIGGAALGAAAVAGHMTITSRLPEAAAYEVPMMYAAGLLHPVAKTAYALVILLSIYTTAISVLYGFVSRLSGPADPRRPLLVVATPVVALAMASIGFSNVVRILYPSVGVAGMVLLVSLALALLRR